MKRETALAAALALTPLSLLLVSTSAPGDVLAAPSVHSDARHDVSLPLREMARTARTTRQLPREMPEPGHRRVLPKGPPGEDPVVQRFYLPAIHTTKVLSFDAVREG